MSSSTVSILEDVKIVLSVSNIGLLPSGPSRVNTTTTTNSHVIATTTEVSENINTEALVGVIVRDSLEESS
jgi:hypothetical protein